jgi:hypothetical protein
MPSIASPNLHNQPINQSIDQSTNQPNQLIVAYLLCDKSSAVIPVFFFRKAAITAPDARVSRFEARLNCASETFDAIDGSRIARPESPKSAELRI